MPDAIIKGEVHTSRGDFNETRDILAEGVDTLVIEGQEGEVNDLGWQHGWFTIAIAIFKHLFAKFLYTDSQTFVDIAKGQGADVEYTRESDSDLIKNSRKMVVAIAAAVFYLFVFVAVFGALVGSQTIVVTSLLLCGLLPIILLRLHETWKANGSRDEEMANKIVEAAEDGGRVVAVMGNEHAKNVPEYLPDDFEPEVKEPKYGVFSTSMLRDLAWPTVRLYGTLALVYPVFVTIVNTYVSFIA